MKPIPAGVVADLPLMRWSGWLGVRFLNRIPNLLSLTRLTINLRSTDFAVRLIASFRLQSILASLALTATTLQLSGFCSIAGTAVSPLPSLQQPPRDCTQVPFWFWNGPLDPEEFRRQLRDMAAHGVYAAMPHPRFGMDRRAYLEEPFWRAMAATLDEAKRLGMQIWLYDEYNWPSGGAGGRVTEAHPELYPRGLDYRRSKVTGPCSWTLKSPADLEPHMQEFERYLAAFVRSVDSPGAWKPWGELSSDGRSIQGNLPEGSWEVLAFFQALGRNPSSLDDGSNAMTDYLSGRSLQRFLSLTHEVYYRRFGRFFGNVIPAVFCDESSTTAPAPFPWTEDFGAEFLGRQGSDILAQLPALLEPEGPQSMRLRLAYWQTVTDLYGGRWLGGYGEWCRRHRLRFTGHVYEENIASYAHAPQLFSLLRPMDLPGFDALGPVCPPHGAKAAISVAHLENREEALCENLGLAGGWNCTLDLLRNGYNQLGWLGVSRFVPHAFFQTVENPRVECPPSFFFQNPYWKYYRTIAELSARLSCFNRLGHHVAPCLLYYPIESLWADSTGGKGQGVLPWQHRSEGNPRASETIRVFNDLADRLPSAHWDLDVADDHLLSQAAMRSEEATVSLRLGPETFQILIVPPLSAIGSAALQKTDGFLQSGGTVLWLGHFPVLTWPHAEGQSILEKWFPNGVPAEPGQHSIGKGRVVVLPPRADAALRWLNDNARPDLKLSDGLSSLRVNHRRQGNLDLYLLYNDSEEWVTGSLLLPGREPAVMVTLDEGAAWRLNPGPQGHPITLSRRQSAVVINGLSAAKFPAWTPKRPAGKSMEISGGWEIQLAGTALDIKWEHRLPATEIQLPVFKLKQRKFLKWDGWTSPGFDETGWETVAAVRGQALSTEPTPLLFRSTLPPGTRSIRTPLPCNGEYALYVNGTLLEQSLGLPGRQPGRIKLSAPSKPGDVLALETVSHSGPAGLERPLAVECGPVPVDELKSWRDWGFPHYAGRVLYRKEVQLERKPNRIWLDLGKVEHYAEVWINGRKAGVLLWPPYTLDITSFCRTGRNEIVLVVANSIANRFAWDVWGTRGSATAEASGLLGPVKLWMDDSLAGEPSPTEP